MAEDGKLTYTKVIYEMAVLVEQLTRLHILEEAIKAAQQGEDFHPS